jgi:SAM-dependent methyltransferase
MNRTGFLPILFCVVGGILLAGQELPEPYASATLLPFNEHGWYENASLIEPLIRERHVRTIIEVGSWMGASTRHMASLLPPGGKLYAVDTWAGSPNEAHDPAVLATLYDQFLANVMHAGLTHTIVPCRLSSIEAALQLNVQADLIYLDATHEYEAALNDLRAWYPHLKQGGIFCGDDWGWGRQGVEWAVRHFTEEKNLNFYTNGWFWYFEKKEPEESGGRLDPMEITKAAYNRSADVYAEKTMAAIPYEEAEFFLQRVGQRGTIIDIGCGPGRDARYFSEKGYSVIGVDFAKAFLKLAQVQAPRAQFFEGNIDNLSFLGAASADGVWANSSLFHLPKEKFPTALRQLHTLLKPHGILFLSMKKGAGEGWAVDPLSEVSVPCLAGGMLKYWSSYQEKELVAFLEEAGFDVIRVHIDVLIHVVASKI